MAKKKSNTESAAGDQLNENFGMVDLFKIFDKLSKKDQSIFLSALSMFDNLTPEEQEELLSKFSPEKADNDMDESNDEEFEYVAFLPCQTLKKFTLRVTLRGSSPSIYRKFVVPSNISLRYLSELLIDLMPWNGSHLNHFRKGREYYQSKWQQDEDSMFFDETHNQEEYALGDILSEKNKSITWEYDFGDSWCHDVKLSSIGEYKEGEPLISFVKGERACPPDDCGGIWGYDELMEKYEKLKSGKRLTKQEKEYLEWYLEEDFEPEFYDDETARIICADYASEFKE